MRERILEFLKSENKSSALLAAEIGVQPSSISHILSGRNNPSLDFVLKMLGKYDYLSADWLLFGKGSMYSGAGDEKFSDIEMSLFRESQTRGGETNDNYAIEENIPGKRSSEAERPGKIVEFVKQGKGCNRIVCFYQDNTFREYFPGD